MLLVVASDADSREERTTVAEAPIRRVGALFGLYIFFNTQPSVSVPQLHSVSHIEVTSGMCTLFHHDLGVLRAFLHRRSL